MPGITGFHGTVNGPQKELCTGSWAGSFTITVAAGGAITGHGAAHTLGQPSCSFKAFADASTAYTFTVEGHAVAGGLELRPDVTSHSPPSGHDYDWFIFAFFGFLRSLPGRGQFVYMIPVSGGGGSAVFHVTHLSPHVAETASYRVGATATILISVHRQP